jgi:hypothetical protein
MSMMYLVGNTNRDFKMQKTDYLSGLLYEFSDKLVKIGHFPPPPPQLIDYQGVTRASVSTKVFVQDIRQIKQQFNLLSKSISTYPLFFYLRKRAGFFNFLLTIKI